MADSEGDAIATGDETLDVLVVGAGPTGLTLAAQLQTFGARLRIIDRLVERGRESRALAVQARSLEVLDALGLADALVSRGNPGARVRIHLDDAVVDLPVGDIGAADTRFPYVLFVSQAETEGVLGAHLAAVGVTIERGVELTGFEAGSDDVACTLRHRDGRLEIVRTRYLAGCDGAHSTVRKGAGIAFGGGAYPQDFMLGDVELEGPLERGIIHAFTGRRGVALFFPLGRPTTWRLIGIEPDGRERADREPTTRDLSLAELQAVADAATGGRVRLHDPAWLTRFRLHHRQAAHYRAGRIFLAGDAAHIHSPVGAQGMNTGIQDAWNLGWKLALVTRGAADPALLNSYEAERWPVGRFLLRYTDRLFSAVVAVARSRLATALRNLLLPHLLPWLMASRSRRARLFRFISQLGIRYRRSPLSREAEPRLRRGPLAGDRLPDAELTRDGHPTSLQRETAGPRLHLLLCGAPEAWDDAPVPTLRAHFGDLLAVHRLTRTPAPGALVDPAGTAFARLGIETAAQYLVRPDGHIAFRCAGTDLEALRRYLERWFPMPYHPTPGPG
ncbi:MAG TPA: FAD-dependent monooxygenase [Longimicrobiales bacterium]